MQPSHAAATRFHVSWATTQDEVREAQRLRHAVFAVEMGARLERPPGTPHGHDCDAFDDHAEHLLVRAAGSGDGAARGPVVGTYRVLTSGAARRAGGFYSETQFDCRALAGLRPRLLELGRSCIAPPFRTGGTILALWSALGDFMRVQRLDLAFGSASIPLRDGARRRRRHSGTSSRRCIWRRRSAA